jgi:hypothetical protein
MHADARSLRAVYDALPLTLGSLKVDQKRDFEARGLQVIDALRQMLRSQFFGALEFDHNLILNQQIGEIFSEDPAFV